MPEYLRIGQASKYLGVSTSSLRNWEHDGLITPIKTKSNQRRYTKAMLDSLIKNQDSDAKRPFKHLTIGYCRVSSNHQKDDLKRQIDVVSQFCVANGCQFKIIQDIGSGLNYKKKGLRELMNIICHKQCERVVVNYQDRLVRFGFDLIQEICQANQVDLIVINQTNTDDPNQELVQDVLSIITVFSAKLYGERSHKNAKIIKANKEFFSQPPFYQMLA